MTSDINQEFIDHAQALRLAEDGVRSLASTRNDRWYPKFHIASDGGWINDPNGLCHYNGRWHVFYQLHPFGTEWGPMHWGHVSSADMLEWKREPIALAPSLNADRDGVFSGCAVEGNDGRLWLFYTGHRWQQGPNGERENLEVQCAAVSKDGVHFDKLGMIIDNPDRLFHFRDPKVWKQDGRWYMVFGMSTPDGRGQILLYSSENMRAWHAEGVLYRHPNPGVYMLECPDFFPLKDPNGNIRWVLCFSAMGEHPNGFSNRNLHNAGYVIGTWEPGERFQPQTEFRMWDWGHNYYAPQSFEAPDGRRIQYGWMSPFIPPHPMQADGWCGQLTIPREVTLDHYGCIRTSPVEEIAALRSGTTDFGSFVLGVNENRVLCDDAEAVEIDMEIDINATTAERAGLKVHSTGDNAHTCVYYDDQTHRVVLDRHAAAQGNRGYRAAPFTSHHLRMRVFVDRSSVEVFINDGEQAMSSYSTPSRGKRAIELNAESGTLAVRSLRIHRLRSIGLDR